MRIRERKGEESDHAIIQTGSKDSRFIMLPLLPLFWNVH